MRNKLFAMMFLVISALLSASCTEEIDSGGLGGMKIGMTKEEVFGVIAAMPDVHGVRAAVRRDTLINSGNLADIRDLSEHDLIIIQGAKFFATVSISGGHIEKIDEPIIKEVDLGLTVGMNMDDFLVRMTQFLKTNPRFYLLNAVKGNRSVGTTETSQEDIYFLFSQHSWVFYGLREYGWLSRFNRVRLYFDGDHLTSIDYYFSPIELP